MSKCGVTDFSDAVCGVCTAIRWIAGEPCKSMGGCDTVAHLI